MYMTISNRVRCRALVGGLPFATIIISLHQTQKEEYSTWLPPLEVLLGIFRLL